MSNKISQYISSFPSKTQEKLESIRACIKQNAPDAEECINYGIPTFRLHGNLVHFAAFKSHIGFYPGASGIAEFQNELGPYHSAKGSVQFPLDAKLPLPLIRKIVQFRVKENTLSFQKKSERTCKQGHTYIKSSECPTCPFCEREKAKRFTLVPGLSAPAQRALAVKGIKTLESLSSYSEKEVLTWHGVGKSSIPQIKAALKVAGFRLKD